jgi:host factor-I protein
MQSALRLSITFSGRGLKMDKPAQNIQDSFLNNARKDKGLVTIYLLSGVKLSGRIKSFDKYSLVLETSNQEQLIFKHAISTVVTTRAVQQHSSGPSSGHQNSSQSAAQSAASAPQHAHAED